MSKKRILLNAFDMNCVGHINHGLWTHPRDRSTEYTSLDHWTDLAKLLERGLFDGLFIADIVGVYDVYQNGVNTTLRESIQLPVGDPLLLVSAMAHVTSIWASASRQTSPTSRRIFSPGACRHWII